MFLAQLNNLKPSCFLLGTFSSCFGISSNELCDDRDKTIIMNIYRMLTIILNRIIMLYLNTFIKNYNKQSWMIINNTVIRGLLNVYKKHEFKNFIPVWIEISFGCLEPYVKVRSIVFNLVLFIVTLNVFHELLPRSFRDLDFISYAFVSALQIYAIWEYQIISIQKKLELLNHKFPYNLTFCQYFLLYLISETLKLEA